MEDKVGRMTEKFCGFLEGHNGSVTCIAVGNSTGDENSKNLLVTGSRDKRLILWKINSESERIGNQYGSPFVSFTEHSNFVSDVCFSLDNEHLLSSSWDNSLLLREVKSGNLIKRMCDNTKKSIFTSTIDPSGRQIFSGCNDNKIYLMNIEGKIKSQTIDKLHSDFVSKVKFSPSLKNKFLASIGYDGRLKLWINGLNCLASIRASDSPLYALAININGIYIATGGKDQMVKIWKISDLSKPFKTFKVNSSVTDIAFNPEYQWIAVSAENSAYIFNLSSENTEPVIEIKHEKKETKIKGVPKFTCLAWNSNAKDLYLGSSDGLIRVHQISLSFE